MITLAAWIAEGERRFGVDYFDWHFRCPACKHVQRVGDFEGKVPKGTPVEVAMTNCIGRYLPRRRRAFGEEGPGPCDYTSGGLLNITPVTVVREDGAFYRVFALGEPENG